MGIAKGLGKPLKVDLTTSNLERARFARVCVEVNLKKPLKGTVMINRQRYYVSYEGLTNICSGCGLYGHLIHSCPKVSREKTSVEVPRSGEVQTGPQNQVPMNDGFVQVRQRGGRSARNRKEQTMEGEAGKGKEGVNVRQLRIRDGAKIAVSNRFDLVKDMEIPSVGEEITQLGENKENENTVNQMEKGRSKSQGNMVFRADLLEKASGPREEKREIRTGPNKSQRNFGTKSRQSQITRPVRGLVFGPIREGGDLSVSGKRMRVETTNTGRAGGVLVIRRESSEDQSLLIQDSLSKENGMLVEMAENLLVNGQENLLTDEGGSREA